MLHSILEQINSIEALRRPKDGVILQPPKQVSKIRKEIQNVYRGLHIDRDRVLTEIAWDKEQAESFYHHFHLKKLPSVQYGSTSVDELFYLLRSTAHSIISGSVEQFRDKGDILSAMRMQQIDSFAKIRLFGSLSEDYAYSLSIFKKLQQEFWNNNQQVLKYLPSGAKVPKKLIQPFLHDDLALPSKTCPRNILKHRDVLGRTPLHTAIKHHGYLQNYDGLQANNNAQDIFGRTPLHIICSLPAVRQSVCPVWSDSLIWFIQLSTTRWFLSRDSVDIHVRDCDGRYAVEYAILDRRPQVLCLFRDEFKGFEPESEVGRLILEALKDTEDLITGFRSLEGM